MKRLTIYRFLALLSVTLIIIASCTKETADVKLDPQLATSQVLNIKSDSATIIGFVVAEGDGFSERGVCYDKAANPTTAKSKVIYSGKTPTATFTVKLGGLNYATKYYARSYAIYDTWTFYGEVLTFTTLPVKPTLTTDAITLITGNSAKSGGNVTIPGGAEVTARGVCYGTKHNPTIADSKTSDGTGTGAFISTLSNLKGNTVYYVRAYATNSAGTGYGPEVEFKTEVDLPVVTTASVTEISKTSAVSGGNVTYDGGGTITARGLAWGTTENPDINGNILPATAETGVFVIDLTNLEKNTIYHIRAYATNIAGTAYGSDLKFTTLGDNRTWNIPGDYVTASYPGSSFSNWSPGASPQVISLVTDPDNIEGYVYMANASNNWKFATQNDWSGPNYTAGTVSGTLTDDPGAANINSPSGYYKINVNAAASPMTFTAVATNWGLIGDATPNSWNDETALIYNPSLTVWTGGFHLKTGAFKFRANHTWDYNYGSTAGDATLDAGGKDIPVTLEDDYAITLDLSHPRAYTYSANRWGLIGGATGGWSTDLNMAWDDVNKVFKVTADLVVGEIKFRANDDWVVNFGGDLNALTQGGANINITEAGNYTVTLDPWAKVGTVTKN